MVTSDKTGDEDTEGAINELADDLLKGDSESVTDALEQALESVRAKDAQEELDRLLRAGKSLGSVKSKYASRSMWRAANTTGHSWTRYCWRYGMRIITRCTPRKRWTAG